MLEDYRPQQNWNRDLHALIIHSTSLPAILPIRHMASRSDPPAIHRKKIQHIQQRPHDKQTKQRQKLLLYQLHSLTS